MESRIWADFHGDDFGAIGFIGDLENYVKFLEQKYRCEVMSFMGLDPDFDKSGRFTKRRISVGPDGWSYEADPSMLRPSFTTSIWKDAEPLPHPALT